jgi:Ser/Thr protein kinase RdoA (MazF antagonist)
LRRVTERSAHPYSRLTPDRVIGSVEAIGAVGDGRLLALNSYENRVYQVGVEGAEPLVVKFYRPGRWSTAAILEEHEFAAELAAAEIPVVAPLARDRQTLFETGGFRFAIYPRRGGRWPDLDTREDRMRMGRFLGRIHLVGAQRVFRHRGFLDWRTLGRDSVRYLIDKEWIPNHVREAYASVTADLLTRIERRLEELADIAVLRLHGDCHPGNVLWTDGPHFVDLDDCLTGPAVQDFWMLLSGAADETAAQLSDYVDGYTEFADFDWRGVRLIESLRSLRQINYAAWLARRWDDPAFPRAFPWFAEPRYWEQHVLDLREQLAALDES